MDRAASAVGAKSLVYVGVFVWAEIYLRDARLRLLGQHRASPATAGSARSKLGGLPQGAVQPVDQRIDLAAMTLEKGLEPCIAVEPSA